MQQENNKTKQEDGAKAGTRNTLTVTDNRTGKTYEIPIEDETVKAIDLRAIKLNNHDFGTMSYDPGYFNTSVCKSKITYIDGEKGILEYRGYPVEQLAEQSNFLEVAFLLIYGFLPNSEQYDSWNRKIMLHTFIHENLVQLMRNFRYDAHPMGMLISSISAMSTFYPEANPALSGMDLYRNKQLLNKQVFRILGKMPTIAACAYRHRIGRPYNNPTNTLSYTENFLYMLDRLSEIDYKPHPVLTRALDKLFIVHADHELNCSTATMRQVGSSLVDPYSAVAGAATALYGPLHGGANEAVLHMLEQIGTKDKIPEFIQAVKSKKYRLMGFGHRVYKSYDPRATILKQVSQEVFALLGTNPLMDIALELERQALSDKYFIDRQLYPNVDFYSGIIYKTMGFPTDMFPVLFTIPSSKAVSIRMELCNIKVKRFRSLRVEEDFYVHTFAVAGWLAHWVEMLQDPDLRIFRPRQIYTGNRGLQYVPVEERSLPASGDVNGYSSELGARRSVSAANVEFGNIPKTVYKSNKTPFFPQEQTKGN